MLPKDLPHIAQPLAQAPEIRNPQGTRHDPKGFWIVADG